MPAVDTVAETSETTAAAGTAAVETTTAAGTAPAETTAAADTAAVETGAVATETAAATTNVKPLTAPQAAMTPKSPVAFSCDGLSVETVTELQQLAERVRALGQKQSETIVEIGRELIAAKEQLPHGQFTPWIDAEFGMTERTAQRYMSAAEWATGKTDIVSVLAPTTIYLLSSKSTPVVAEEQVISRIRSGGTIGTEEIKKIVTTEKEKRARTEKVEREARRRARLSLEKRSGDEELEDKRRQKQAEREAAQREREARERTRRCEQAAAILQKRLGEDLNAFLELVAAKNSSPLLDCELLEQLR